MDPYWFKSAEERVEMDSNALIVRTTEEGFQNAIHRGEKRKLDDDNEPNEKVEKAIRYNIHVVTPEWLIDCYEQWERKAEENYVLHPNYDVKKSRLFTKETPRMGKLFS